MTTSTVAGLAAAAARTSRSCPGGSASVVLSCASRPLISGWLPTTTTHASAPAAARRTASAPSVTTRQENSSAPSASADALSVPVPGLKVTYRPATSDRSRTRPAEAGTVP